MNLSIKGDAVIVSLSERNVTQLLEQMQETGQPAEILRRTDAGRLTVIVEPDHMHYHSELREQRAKGEAGSRWGYERIPIEAPDAA